MRRAAHYVMVTLSTVLYLRTGSLTTNFPLQCTLPSDQTKATGLPIDKGNKVCGLEGKPASSASKLQNRAKNTLRGGGTATQVDIAKLQGLQRDAAVPPGRDEEQEGREARQKRFLSDHSDAAGRVRQDLWQRGIDHVRRMKAGGPPRCDPQ